MTASRIFLYFCLSFIGGIFLNSVVKISQLLMLGALIFGILLIFIPPSLNLRKRAGLVAIGFCILFLVVGIWRHQLSGLRIIRNNELRKYNDQEKIITLVGVIAKEPDIREKSVKLTVQPENINGKVLVTANRYPEYQYGDKLKITGKLKTPQVFSEGDEDKSSSSSFAIAQDFNYKDYLKKDGIYSVMDWPKIELLERGKYTGPTRAIYAIILDFKNKLRESIYQNLSPPESSILGAMILGDKRKISDEWKNKLNIAGVRHITAVSGLHVTVLSSILMTFLLWLGFWRQQAFFGAILIIALFIVMTGLQPSAIRAGIMGGLFLLAQYFGRMNSASRAIFFAGAVMLAQNPLLLKLDVGFQLSFLAMMGIIYLMPIFRDYFLKRFPIEWFQKYWWLSWLPIKSLGGILVMTFSAYLFTLPILIYNFGYISLVAPITNILIVPLLYLIMIFGFLFGLAGMIWQPLGWLLSLPAWLLLTYVIKIVDISSKLPFAFKTLEISWIWLAISYLILGLVTWRLQESQKLKFLGY